MAAEDNNPQALLQLAWAAESAGKYDEMAAQLTRLVEITPGDYKAHQELGLCLIRLGQKEKAVQALRRTTTLAPAYAPGHCNLGLALEGAGDISAAADSMKEALRLDPHSSMYSYHLAAINAQAGRPFAAPPACPKDYLVKLFDSYAGRFDQHLFQSLQYRGPALLADAVFGLPEAPPQPWNILDLGCGTGMTAVPFRRAARSIVGVDLAPRMLQIAGRRTTTLGQKVYDELLESDLVPALLARPAAFDLILAADVFIYIGDLRVLFSAVARSLRNGAIFAFTIEVWNGPDDYRLLPTRRYAQSRGYIQSLSRQAGLTELIRQSAALRLGEDQQPVTGEVWVLRK